MRMLILGPVVCLAALIAVGIPVVTGVYVYKDAQKRGMNAPLWTLVAILAPSLVGFIIYLLVRGSYRNLKCPRCEAPVEEGFAVCPQCGAKLRAACGNCGDPVEAGWKICPRCAKSLTPDAFVCTPPAKKQDHLLGKILAAVVIFPLLLLLALGVLAMAGYTQPGAYNQVSMTVAEYAENQKNEAIVQWVEEQQDAETVQVLHYGEKRDAQWANHWLILIPGAGEETQANIVQRPGLFRPRVEVLTVPGGEGQGLIWISTYTKAQPQLTLYVDGGMTDYTLTESEHNPALFELIAE